ncbi:TPA: lpg1689 family Dot/Icm T4SS effector [Legionella pneumophila]|nr:lpg1689 family Dot/Icm T4SS effector [Legionella pneumophila]
MYHYLFSCHKSQESIDGLIEQVKQLLNHVEMEQKAYFLNLLTARVTEFQNELKSETSNTINKQQILIQYERFANTLLICIKQPERTSSAIHNYHKGFYYPVAIHDKIKLDPTIENAAIATLGVSLALLLGSIPTFIFNPLFGVIMVSLAVTLLLPSGFYLLIPDSPDTTSKKEEEKRIFMEGAKIINPDVRIEEFDEQPYLSASFIKA